MNFGYDVSWFCYQSVTNGISSFSTSPDVVPKDSLDGASHFRLATKTRCGEDLEYRSGDSVLKSVRQKAHNHLDKDILIFCISQLMQL
jgi:hypothetical protein